MKKNLKIKTATIITSCLLLYASSLQATDKQIIKAIQNAEKSITSTLKTNNTTLADTINSQMAGLFDEALKGVYEAGKLVAVGTLDKKIAMYVENFYSWFTTQLFSGMNLTAKNKENNEGVRKLLAQEIGYNLEKNRKEKIDDTKALLAQPIEGGGNNLDPENLLGKKALEGKTSISPYGPLADKAPAADGIPNVADLIGPDGYDEEGQKKARLFINYILQAIPNMKTIYIPAKKRPTSKGLFGAPKSTDEVSIFLPKNDEKSGLPYKVAKVSIVRDKKPKEGLAEIEYDRMKEYLEAGKGAEFYLPYKMKVRTSSILRSIYLDNLMRSYQERVKDPEKSNDESLVEKEREAAIYGLDKSYYEDLKKKTMADINLETLRAINKLAYFLYKIHEDNIRNSLVMSVSGMALLTQDQVGDEQKLLNPIMTIIENKCWNEPDDPKRKKACDTPLSAGAPAMEIE